MVRSNHHNEQKNSTPSARGVFFIIYETELTAPAASMDHLYRKVKRTVHFCIVLRANKSELEKEI